MADVTVYGFPISTFVNIVRAVLTEKGVPFDFHDMEREMGGSSHLALHPFNRVPILRHGDFTLYETAAIVTTFSARGHAADPGRSARGANGPGSAR